MNDKAAAPWYKRSRIEWSLRCEPVTTVLMRRTCDEHGNASDGQPAGWHDVATFKDHNKAREVLVILSSSAGSDS